MNQNRELQTERKNAIETYQREMTRNIQLLAEIQKADSHSTQ